MYYKTNAHFEGQIGGDGECFRWQNVPESHVEALIGTRAFKLDQRLGEQVDVLYPGTVMDVLGVEHGKRYRFTITAEELK